MKTVLTLDQTLTVVIPHSSLTVGFNLKPINHGSAVKLYEFDNILCALTTSNGLMITPLIIMATKMYDHILIYTCDSFGTLI